MKRNALIIITPALAVATFLVIQAPAYKLPLFFIGLFLGAVSGLAIVLFLRFRLTLGSLTALAAVSILSGLFFVLVAWASPVCPADEYETRCPPFVLGNVAVTGALTPILIGFCLIPFILIYKLARGVYDIKTGKRPGELKALRKVLSFTGISAKESSSSDTRETRTKVIRAGGEKKGVPTPKRPKPPTSRSLGRG